ncbi:MAG: hypothetical protein AAF497_01880 [Planctomycetota bacterium]
MTDTQTNTVRPTDHRSEYEHLFPLPLTVFERLMIEDDRPGYPMNIVAKLHFRGRLDQPAFLQSVAEAAGRHPMLLCHLTGKGSKSKWELAENPQVSVTIVEGDNAIAQVVDQPQIDIRKECGVRVIGRIGGDESSVEIELHHAACDGQGCRFFIIDFVTAYARLMDTSGSPPPWLRINYDRLRQRGQFAAKPAPEAPEEETTETSLAQKIKDAWAFANERPRPLRTKTSKPIVATTHRPRVLEHYFSAAETSHFQQLATEAHTTLNDVAIALMFKTAAEWNARHGASPSEQVRVVMPTDLRDRRDGRMTATNRMSYAFIVRRISDCKSTSELLQGLFRQTRYIKQVRLGLDFLFMLGLLGKIPGAIRGFTRMPSCFATVVLTNLGETTRQVRRRFPSQDGIPKVGNLLLERLIGVPPIRPRTKVSAGLCFCSGVMGISLRCDPQWISADESQQFLDAFVSTWRQWADEANQNQPNELATSSQGKRKVS